MVYVSGAEVIRDNPPESVANVHVTKIRTRRLIPQEFLRSQDYRWFPVVSTHLTSQSVEVGLGCGRHDYLNVDRVNLIFQTFLRRVQVGLQTNIVIGKLQETLQSGRRVFRTVAVHPMR